MSQLDRALAQAIAESGPQRKSQPTLGNGTAPAGLDNGFLIPVLPDSMDMEFELAGTH